MTSISIAAYLVLFGTVAFLFLVVSLCLGRLLRPSAPTAEKLETYECGEPAIGSSFVQFNLRFYVVALVFIIFEVEMAFFFPWATVFGKLAQLSNPQISAAAAARTYDQLAGRPPAPSAVCAGAASRDGSRDRHAAASGGRAAAVGPHEQKLGELKLSELKLGNEEIRHLLLAAMADIALFFAILLVGFAYVWKRGDLDWVRAAATGPSKISRVQELAFSRR
jgi:NADH-quinone oxidoreductase subunit A